ncbi:hypothetical protein SAMN05421823_101449 [Catalinimonas alkaloidigena]|uniref:Lipoprotein n=1 Tax=Catalinimonas alkaloidigena TaxID=1075417 RepID=A0A1G8XR92_9BACT|nr:hypothetical protein [Catalinimonas alkaloidigena]SDJ92946.1 hypothetical protein SAMN05421823_101449 [Catalinimonas alkaloidigena]
MRYSSLIFAFAVVAASLPAACTQAQSIPNKEQQISAALLAAPEPERAEATVLGYDAQGKVVTLREGTNSQICRADDPNQPGFEVVCYHKDLEPFMARGRALREEGKNGRELFDIREAEAKAGTLKMPTHPATLHILAGADAQYDPATNQVTGANYRYVVYIPFATAASTGLPERPTVPGGPWIMDPGTHRAHIMITPPAQE